jgi:TP901 family phage tail tape measure protein
MANISTMLTGSTEDVTRRTAEWRKEILRLSMETGKTFEDLTGGGYEAVSAFGDSAEAVKKLDLAVKAGVAGRASTLESMKLLSAITKAYGDMSMEATLRTSDLAFETVRLGQTTFPELAGSMGRVTSDSVKLGVKVEELFAIYATLTGVVGDATIVTTRYGAILRGLMDPTPEMSRVLERLNFVTTEAMIKELGLVESLRRMLATTDGTTESVKALIGPAEALGPVFALTGAQSDEFDRKLAVLQQTIGATETAFKKQMGTLKAWWDRVRQIFLVSLVKIGDALEPVMRETIFPLLEKGAEKLLKMAEAFAALPGEAVNTRLKFIALAAATGPLLSVASELTIVLGGLLVGLTVLTSHPVVLFAAGCTLALAGLDDSLWKNIERWRELRAETANLKGELAKLALEWDDWEKRVVKLHSELATLNNEWAKVASESLAQDYFERRYEAGLDPFGGAWGERKKEIAEELMDLEEKLKAIDERKILPEQAAKQLEAETATQKRMEETAAMYREIETDMLSEKDREILAIHEKAAEYEKAGVDRLTLAEYINQKESELAQRWAEEQTGYLDEVGRRRDETFKPQWYTAEGLARRAAETGIESRFGGGQMPIPQEAISGQSEASRASQNVEKILERIEFIGASLLRLVETNPAGTVQ